MKLMHINTKTLLICLMTKDSKRKYFHGQRHGEQSVVLDCNIVNMFYNEQVVSIERFIENFTSVEGTGATVANYI